MLTIKNPEERSFYEIEATQAGWSLPELKRQVASCLYERLALSRDQNNVRQLASEGQRCNILRLYRNIAHIVETQDFASLQREQ